jgi:3-oxoacyl-[acyl-carrier protein] reductase
LRLGERIVNFSSSVVGLALAGYAVYAATKSAIETLTNIFAKELRGREISVNAVAPGPTATDLLLEDKTPEQIAHLAKMPPLERLGRPEDIAGVVSFLVGPGGGGSTVKPSGPMAASSDQSPHLRRHAHAGCQPSRMTSNVLGESRNLNPTARRGEHRRIV